MCGLHGVPVVDGVVVGATHDVAPRGGEAAAGEARVGGGGLVLGNLLVAPQVPHPGRLVLRPRGDSLA